MGGAWFGATSKNRIIDRKSGTLQVWNMGERRRGLTRTQLGPTQRGGFYRHGRHHKPNVTAAAISVSTQFRPGQRDVVDAVASGHDVMCVMPTGGGKSLCYQLPSLSRAWNHDRCFAADRVDEGPGRFVATAGDSTPS